MRHIVRPTDRGELVNRLAVGLALMLTLVLVSCSPSSPAPRSGPPGDTVRILGPYPQNVEVNLGRIGLTLTGVRVLTPDTPAGSFLLRGYSSVEPSAPVGSRFVDVTVTVRDPANKYFETPGHDLLANPVVVAAGKTIPVGAQAFTRDFKKPGFFDAQMEFAIPDSADGAVVRLPLSAESSDTPSFRLW